jgi:hypothetical protein
MKFYNHCYKLTIFKNHFARDGIQKQLSKFQFLELLKYDIRTAKNGPLFSPAEFDGVRSKQNTKWVHMLVFDIDGGAPYMPLYNTKFDFDWVTYTTFSHTAEVPKWRLVIPLAKPIPGEHWQYAFAAMLDLWRTLYPEHEGAPDKQCKDKSRMYYLPACPPDKQNTKRLDCDLNENLYTLQYDYIIRQREAEQAEYKRLLDAQKQFRKKNRNRKPLYWEIKRELALEYATNVNYRQDLASRIGNIKGDRCEDFDCPVCGQNDATFFYINPMGGHRAYCAHMNSCGTQGVLTSFSLLHLASFNNII